MINLLRQGESMAHGIRHKHATDSVMYFRQDDDGFEINATVGRTESDAINNQGIVIQNRSRDFIVRPGDLLMMNGMPFTPMKGDKIVETNENGSKHVFDVMPKDDGKTFEWDGEFRNAIRIFTKFRKVENAT